MKKNIFYFYYLMLLVISFAACKKREETASQIIITSILPNSGEKDTEVMLTGSGFDLNPQNNTVLFNGKEAEVLEATATTLKVKSPIAAGTGVVEVVAKNGTRFVGPIFYHRWIATVSTLNTQGANFDSFRDLAIDAQGNLYVTDGSTTKKAYKITPNGIATNIGTFSKWPYGIAVDAQGIVYVSDIDAHCIYKIANGQQTVFVGKENTLGDVDAQGETARFNRPSGLSIDQEGNIYVKDRDNKKLKKITPQGNVSTINSFSVASGGDCQIDRSGNIWTSEPTKILKLVSGSTLVVAGDGLGGFQDGLATLAKFDNTFAVFPALGGDIFMTDYNNQRLRYLTQDGYVLTLAGNGNQSSKDGVGTTAEFNFLGGIVDDNNGNLWIADQNTIRKVTLQ